MKYIQIYANPEMCLKYLFLGSKRSVLTELIFVQGNNHAADDINSCEFSVNAADHIILCCMDFRIFWNFFMLQDKSLMLSDTINSCCLDTAFYAAHGRYENDGCIFLCGQQHFLLCPSSCFCARKQSCCWWH